MSSKNKKKNVNIEKNKKQGERLVKKSVDNDMEECDKLLEQLDEMELENQSESMSSRVKNLIREDKEAIRIMNEKLKEMDNDELDYLDDEKIDDESASTESEDEVKQELTDNTEKKEEANLDFFANLNREDRIRKQQPRKLHNRANDLRLWNRMVIFAKENTKNFFVGTTIAILFVALAVALVLDMNHNQDDSKESKSKYVTEFLSVDTTPMIAVMNNYYAALENGETDVVRNLLTDGDNVTDEEIAAKCEEANMYGELVGKSFLVTDCYVQQGLNDNEYIAYMKFQLQIKNIKTPTVGIFTCYFVDVSTKDKIEYKISSDVNDKSSDVYKYIIKMSNCQNVTDLFSQVDKELEDACAKDADLKAIVDALEQNNDSADNSETTESNEKNTDNDRKEDETETEDKK